MTRPSERITRRDALRDLGLAGLGMTAAGAGIEALLADAAAAAPRHGSAPKHAAAPRHGSLRDIEHVVILIQENRSFDHYFGTLSGVRGFGDKRGRAAFTQRGADGKSLAPFRLPGKCLPDLTHEWAAQHRAWNGGRMNRFLFEHEQADVPSGDGSPNGTGVETLGYYTRADLRFYYALADAFTICDGYHCSVIGPTDPNRLMSMSASIDPAGKGGGPLLETAVATRPQLAGHFTWTTMPERLQAHGIPWKVYTSPAGGIFDNVLPYFRAYAPGTELYARGIAPSYPNDFMADIEHGALPQVSWVLAGLTETGHPGFSNPNADQLAASQVVQALVSHPAVWKKTALFITWDENGGFFDHVPPPTPRAGTKGEFLTVASLPTAAQGIRGPVGLGFRVPMLVVSPFSRGGLVCSNTFDHTSTLRFLETRFGVEVPNLGAWRRSVTGDLTRAFNFAARPSSARPRLAAPSMPATCASYQPPKVPRQGFPRQERGSRRRPSGIVR